MASIIRVRKRVDKKGSVKKVSYRYSVGSLTLNRKDLESYTDKTFSFNDNITELERIRINKLWGVTSG